MEASRFASTMPPPQTTNDESFAAEAEEAAELLQCALAKIRELEGALEDLHAMHDTVNHVRAPPLMCSPDAVKTRCWRRAVSALHTLARQSA